MVDLFNEDEDKEEVVNLDSFPLTDEVLKTTQTKCLVCGVGDVVKHRDKTSFILIYGREGIRKAKHEEYGCNFRNQDVSCRAGYFHGFMSHQGLRIYEDDALKNKVLVVSTQSAFDVD